ncbi:MAG: helix-turn-helix transcriptional regulator [Rubrivivax sp.]|nr:helix-turn-helix transcriptional regulator [Rubrivivax sp.]
MPALRFGDCELDLSAQRLRRAGQAVALSPRYFAVLAHLAGSAGRLVTKDELLDAVWGHRHVSDSVLKVAVNAVRNALGDDPRAPRHLETVPRRGYRFIATLLPDAPAPPPTPAPAGEPAPGNLPPPAPGLFGRDDELQRLADALQQHRLVTLHGPGGVGKTRLALTAAARAPRPDGTWLLRLDALADGAALRPSVARLLGLAAGSDADDTTLARALRPLQALLVLDNAEHLHGAVAALAAALGEAGARLQLLVTSQVPLRVADEQLMPLGPLLPLPDGADPAVDLLLERVRQLQGEAQVDSAAREPARAIARSLDGLPLALELAAARVPLLGWEGVRARLGERLSLLTRGSAHGTAERHRSLRAVLDWTHALLAPAEQQVLHRLSVLAGPFTVDTAVAVCAPLPEGQVIDHLDTLRERALLVRAGPGSPPRWRLYDSVRAHAAEALAAEGATRDTVCRLARHLAACFAQAEAVFQHQGLAVWMQRLQPEVDSLREALRLALADPLLDDEALELLAASTHYRVRDGWRGEALADYTTLQARRADLDPDPDRQARLDLVQAQLATLGQVLPPQPALQRVCSAAERFEATGDRARAFLARNLVCGLLLRLQSAQAERRQAIDQLQRLQGPDWGVLARRQVAWAEVMFERDFGTPQRFEERCAAHMASSRALGDAHGAWIASQALAQVMAAQGRTDTALALLQRTVDEMRGAGELRANLHVLAQWVTLRITLDEGPEACRLVGEAAQRMHDEGRLWWMADALPWCLARRGDWEQAARLQAWADGLVKARSDRRGPMFGAVRRRFGEWLEAQPQAEALRALLQADSGLDDETALALARA